MKKRLTMILVCMLVGMSIAWAQTKVTGTVVSEEDGQPVVGATVKVEGTKLGAPTDANGRFTITLPPGKRRLQVSYIGLITQTVTAKDGMRIALRSDAHALDEVMVVAYGTAKKSAFTGSATVMKSEDLSKKVTTNVSDALVGSVAGLQMRGSTGQPGETGSINIRGISSMYSDVDPLIIVDGAPYPASLSNIPTSDIESVTVLKDAASAALYGARGAGGVIIITTKKGQKRDAEINVDMKWGWNSRAVQDYDRITDPGQFYEAYYSQLYNYLTNSQGMDAQTANLSANTDMLNQLGYNVYTVPDGQVLIGTNGKLNPNATLGRTYTFNGTQYYMTPDIWQDIAYRNSLRQEYNVSVSGGNDKTSIYASLGYLDDEGIIINSDYKRVSARIKADYQAKKWLKLGMNAQYVHSTQDQVPNLDNSTSAGNIMFFTANIAPIYPAYVRVIGADGTPVIKTDQYGNQAYDYGVAATNYGVTRPFLGSGNPLGDVSLNNDQTTGDQLNGSFTADVQLTDYLKFNATSTVIYGMSQRSLYSNPFYGAKVASNGELLKANSNNLRTNNVQTLTFSKEFGDHNVTAMAGHEYYKTTTKYLEAKSSGGFSPDVQELNAFATPMSNNSYELAYNVEGYFFNGQYNYNDKYFASASYRRDASSRFAKDNRWGNFWSVGGAWLINKETWFNAPWVDELKLKASIGQQGNDNLGQSSYGSKSSAYSWQYTDLYLLSASGSSMSASFYTKGNPDITWETTTNFNIGAEFSLFKGRLTGSLDFYNKKTTDLLFYLNTPESAGYRGYYTNVGDISNQGVELTLTGGIVRTKDIDWSLTVNLSHNKTKILSLPESSIKDLGGFKQSDNDNNMISFWYKEGGELYNAFVPSYAGVNEEGEALYWVDDDMEGSTASPGSKKSSTTTEYDKATYYEQGSILPKVFGGFSTDLRLGNFDLSATFDFQLGGKVYDLAYQNLMKPAETAGDAGNAYHKDYINSWSETNKSSDIPRWQYGDKYTAARSDRFLESASYLNFQSFTVGYTLPNNLINGISKIRFYCSGENIGFISARKGLDPRYSYAGNTSYAGTYSPARNISGGVQLTF